MKKNIHTAILGATGAIACYEIETIQSLWSGYGSIVRYGLKGSAISSVIVKHVRIPESGNHPRGWNTDLSHQRKIKSYEVEKAWYKQWYSHCDQACRVPNCLALAAQDNEVLMVLEDLDEIGFPARRTSVTDDEIKACLAWLANFHATFLNEQPKDLWSVGTYWHLATRPDELLVLNDAPLKKAAVSIDQQLSNSPYQTFVHGDAKLANFCFSNDGKRVAAVDFQYVGGGCGMKDVAYFIGSCLDENACQRREAELLDYYFQVLERALLSKHKAVDNNALEQDWRKLYPVAWTDFHRFLKGWSPGHWKINGYSERLAGEVLAQLDET